MPAAVLKSPASPAGIGPLLGFIARGILVLIAAFWVWFCVLDGIGDAKQLGIMGFIMMLPAALIAVAVLYVVWRWERIGAYLLLAVTLAGLYIMLHNYQRNVLPNHGGPGEMLFGLAIFVLPFLAPALLLLAKQSLEHHPPE